MEHLGNETPRLAKDRRVAASCRMDVVISGPACTGHVRVGRMDVSADHEGRRGLEKRRGWRRSRSCDLQGRHRFHRFLAHMQSHLRPRAVPAAPFASRSGGTLFPDMRAEGTVHEDCRGQAENDLAMRDVGARRGDGFDGCGVVGRRALRRHRGMCQSQMSAGPSGWPHAVRPHQAAALICALGAASRAR